MAHKVNTENQKVNSQYPAMRLLASLLLGAVSIHAGGLRCRRYRWNSEEARYVCEGDDNELSHSEDGIVEPYLAYLGEGLGELGVCQGRCHYDDDCAGDLVCVPRDPTIPEVDGCAGGDKLKFMNYCFYSDPDNRPEAARQQNHVASSEVVGNLMYVGEPPFSQQKLQVRLSHFCDLPRCRSHSIAISGMSR